jgi:hypothetical protein
MRRLLLWTSVIGSFALIAPFQIEAQAPLPGPKAVPPANPVRPQAPRQGSPAAKPPTNALETTKRSKVPDTGGSTGFYGSIELLHVGNRYEASRDTLVRQDATGQSRLILGYKLPESNLDIYATLGAVKQPRSQQLVARRPEVEADLHFLRTSDYNLLGYAIHKIPWSEDPMDPELTLPQKHGSETLLGGRLTFGNQKVPSAPSIFFFGGADAWTKMFSRRQYVAKEDKETQQFGLVQNSNGELVDDDMQHLHSEYHLGMGYVLSGTNWEWTLLPSCGGILSPNIQNLVGARMTDIWLKMSVIIASD